MSNTKYSHLINMRICALTAMYLRSLIWDFAQRLWIMCHSRFGTSFRSIFKKKVATKKGKFTLQPATMALRRSDDTVLLFMLPGYWMRVGGQRHAPAALPLGWVSARCLGGWLGPRAVLEGCGNLPSHGDSIPGPV
jgi:hypothetical protein